MPHEVAVDVAGSAVLGELIPAQASPAPCLDWNALLSHRLRLVALARRCGCPGDDVADVVQEALLRVALQPPALPEKSLAFLSSTVRRLVTDRHRDRQRQQRLTEHAALRPKALPGPEEHICDRAEAIWLQAQTAALRPRERQVLLARAAGRTTTQIALELQTTVKTVEHLTQRARRALRALTVAGCALVCLLAAATHSSKAPPHRYVFHPAGGSVRHGHPHVVLHAAHRASPGSAARCPACGDLSQIRE